MKHKAKIYRNLVIPKELAEELELLAKGRTLHNCYYILWTIINDYRKEYKDYETFRPIPVSYFKQMIGEKYMNTLRILLEHDIVQRTEYYSEGQCYKYRLHPSYYFLNDLVSVKFTYYAKSTKQEYLNNKAEKDSFLEVFNSLEIPYIKLYAKVQEKASELSLDDYKSWEDIDWEYHRMYVTEVISELWDITTKKMTQEEAIQYAMNSSKALVEDKGTIYIVDKDLFLETKRNHLNTTWTASIDNLRDESSLYARRNSTNNRLDTNFTNMSSELFDIICEHNDLNQLDVKNSQPALLGHLLEGNEEDVVQFKDLVSNGIFYEHIGAEFNILRPEAKQMTFEILFGRTFRSKNAKKFVKSFPTVSKFITDFKSEHGYNQFSIMLQKLESNIFIDNLYYPLQDLGIKVLTKHDSVIFKSEDYATVLELVKEVFKGLGFEAKIKNELTQQAI